MKTEIETKTEKRDENRDKNRQRDENRDENRDKNRKELISFQLPRKRPSPYLSTKQGENKLIKIQVLLLAQFKRGFIKTFFVASIIATSFMNFPNSCSETLLVFTSCGISSN
jgi:hypothetical protein